MKERENVSKIKSTEQRNKHLANLHASHECLLYNVCGRSVQISYRSDPNILFYLRNENNKLNAKYCYVIQKRSVSKVYEC